MRVTQQITYEAKDNAEAIRIASDRLGRDAVILSTHTVSKGGFLGFFAKSALMVTAGLLEEDVPPPAAQKGVSGHIQAFQRLLDDRQRIFLPSPQDDSGVVEATTSHRSDEQDLLELSANSTALSRPAVLSQKVAQAYGKTGSDASREASLFQDVEQIQKTLAMVLERLDQDQEPSLTQSSGPLSTVDEKNLDEEDVSHWRDQLIDAEMTVPFVDDLLSRFRAEANGREFLPWLQSLIKTPYVSVADALGGGRVMFIGPTGVGKTTTIAKLAAVNALWEERRVFLVTADTYRIAAVEQLRTYAKILGVPVEVVFEAEDLKKIREKPGADLILLDTAGRSQKDVHRSDELCSLYEAFSPESVHLLLSANAKYRDMLNVVKGMNHIPITSLVFTKLDETVSLGPVLELALSFQLPLSFFAVGQNVPNDIEVASSSRLLEMALDGGFHV
ncbi:MAG: flagellar biosynthesis protein FlhF [Dethiosulfovibrio peptidovorans]|nr:MAG: flagellar biosynthesis protein FlhF [Dethiosulfovibrio peptidovorans]